MRAKILGKHRLLLPGVSQGIDLVEFRNNRIEYILYSGMLNVVLTAIILLIDRF